MKALTLALALLAAPALAEIAPMGDDGLHKEPWLRDTFKDLREDLIEANAEGRRLALMVEQRGCVYCTQMHEEVFSDPAIRDYIAAHFFVVQVNLHGDTETVDFDGESLSEKAAARKWRVLFTPSILFLPQEVGQGVNAADAAVAVMPGAFGKGTTIDMFTWVAQERYLAEGDEDFQRYHARRIRERSNGSTD